MVGCTRSTALSRLALLHMTARGWEGEARRDGEAAVEAEYVLDDALAAEAEMEAEI